MFEFSLNLYLLVFYKILKLGHIFWNTLYNNNFCTKRLSADDRSPNSIDLKKKQLVLATGQVSILFSNSSLNDDLLSNDEFFVQLQSLFDLDLFLLYV